jgi:hypothetical protein
MIEFCFWANDQSNWASRFVPFPMRQFLGRYHLESDENIPLPIVPHEYDPFLLKRPVMAAVLSSTSTPAEESTPKYPLTRTSVDANAGRDQGLVEGMHLFLVDVRGFGRGLVEQVDDSTCRVVFIHSTPQSGHSAELIPGARLSSIAPRD